jgi:hypothetical protein
LQNTLVRVRPNSGTCPDFALHLFQHLHYTGRFAAIASQTTSIAHLGVSRFAALTIRWPELPEQEQIAAALSRWDRATGLVQALLRAKRRLKRGLAQQLLTGKRRFREFEGEPWKEHQIGEVLERVARPGQLISLESTTYPGTTEDVLVPAARRAGLELDRDVFVSFSPERVDPGHLRKLLIAAQVIADGVVADHRQQIVRGLEPPGDGRPAHETAAGKPADIGACLVRQ